jgi:hypothetical protein
MSAPSDPFEHKLHEHVERATSDLLTGEGLAVVWAVADAGS